MFWGNQVQMSGRPLGVILQGEIRMGDTRLELCNMEVVVRAIKLMQGTVPQGKSGRGSRQPRAGGEEAKERSLQGACSAAATKAAKSSECSPEGLPGRWQAAQRSSVVTRAWGHWLSGALGEVAGG